MLKAFLLIASGGMLLAQSPPLLDLAANPPKPWSPPAISGAVGGGGYDAARLPEPKLPLEIELESIEPIPGDARQRLVNILIRNIGSEPYMLPVGRDPDVALKPSNHGRCEFWFDLKVASERYFFLLGQETYGSPDVPDTMMTIPPQGAVHVRFKIDVANALRQTPSQWRNELPKQVNVQAVVVHEVLEDNPRAYIHHVPAPDAFSANELRLQLVPDEEPRKPSRE